MLVFFLLCAFLQTLWGKPLPPPLGPSSAATANLTPGCNCPTAPDEGQQLRSVYDIVQSCLFTIFACVWSSIHANINGPRDSWWTCMKRRVVTTLNTAIAPEVVLLWALRQRFAAKQIADKYNKEFKTLEETETSVWAKLRQLFKPLPQSTTRRGARQAWTITHGFFLQMGGFILYEGEYPKEVLTYKRLADLLRKDAIDSPTVTERDLQDKSKGDTISKGIVLLQTLWFVLQCVVRAVQRLPLSELEVLTLAFAVMNGAIYAAWWSKPQGVDMIIFVPLKQAGDSASAANSDPAPASSYQTDGQHSDSDNQPLMQSKEHLLVDEKDIWLRRILRKDRRNYSSPFFLLVRLPYRLFGWMLHPFGKAIGSSKTPEGLHMPMFYSEYEAEDLGSPEYVAFVIGIIFGGIHLLGWKLEFPLLRDRILWRVSAAVLTAVPFTMLLGAHLPDEGALGILQRIVGGIFLVVAPVYIVARFVVIVIAFKAILHPPYNVLLDISWTRYIPHF